MKKSVLLVIFLLVTYISFGQVVENEPILIPGKIRISSFGLGSHSLGLSEFNWEFRNLGLKTPPERSVAFYFDRFNINEGKRFYSGFGVAAQTAVVADESPGELSYTFVKQNLQVNAGYFLFENERFLVPLQAGAGFAFMVFNSHSNFDNEGKDFSEVLESGTGTGIYNLSEISIMGSLTTGFDFKTSSLNWKQKRKETSLNIGIRTGILYSFFQGQAPLGGVVNVPKTDRLNYYISLNISTYLFPCK